MSPATPCFVVTSDKNGVFFEDYDPQIPESFSRRITRFYIRYSPQYIK
jgi:hypothetical protein